MEAMFKNAITNFAKRVQTCHDVIRKHFKQLMSSGNETVHQTTSVILKVKNVVSYFYHKKCFKLDSIFSTFSSLFAPLSERGLTFFEETRHFSFLRFISTSGVETYFSLQRQKPHWLKLLMLKFQVCTFPILKVIEV